MNTEKSDLCFVLMPFKDTLTDVYEKAIRPACLSAGLKPLRVDELAGIYNINRKIIEYIFVCDVIIADLTGWNPNVFYELGIAHAIGNKTIMIIQRDEKIPFDVSSYNCIIYEYSDVGLNILKKRLINPLLSFREWSEYPTNPVQDYKPFEINEQDSNKERFKNKIIKKDIESPSDSKSKSEMIRPRVFISYAWENKDIARNLENDLRLANADVWIDHAVIRGGDNLPRRISEALKWCNTLLLLWSTYADKSKWVELEWTNALSLNKIIIPFTLDNTTLPSILSNTAYINGYNLEDGFDQLLFALRLKDYQSTSQERSMTQSLFNRIDFSESPPDAKKPPEE